MATATPLSPPPLPTCEPIFCPRPAQDLLRQVDVVFRGTVVELEQLGPDRDWRHRLAFEVHEVWKGPIQSRIELTVSQKSWACDRRFALGQETVVFAVYEPSGDIQVEYCNSVAVEEDPAAELGEGRPVEVVQPVAHFGGAIVDIEVAGDLAWMAQGPRVMAVDVSERAAPRALEPGIQLPEIVRSISIDGERALAQTDGMLYLLDLSAPAAPVIVSRYGLETNGKSHGPVVLAGDLAFVKVTIRSFADGYPRNVDVLDLASGRWIRHGLVEDANARVDDLIRLDDRLIVSTRDHDSPELGHLRIFPTVAIDGMPGFGLNEIHALEEETAGDLDVAEVAGEARLYSASNERFSVAAWALPSDDEPRFVERWPLHRVSSDSLGDLAVLADGGVYLQDYQPHGNTGWQASVVKISEQTFDDRHFLDAAGLFGSRAFPSDLERLGDDHLLVGDMNGLAVLEPGVEDRAASLGYLPSLVDAAGLVAGPSGWLVGASSYGSLLTYDLSDALAPRARGQIIDIDILDGLTAGGGLAVWNTSGPFDIHLMDSRVIDLSDPGAPRAVGSVFSAEPVRYTPLAQAGRLLVHGQELKLVDLGAPSAPVELDSLAVDGPVVSVDTDGQLVIVGYLGTQPAGPERNHRSLHLLVARIEGAGDQRRLVELSDRVVSAGGWSLEVLLDGETAWLSLNQGCSTQMRSWLLGIDLSNPSSPRDVGWLALPGYGSDLSAAQGMLFASGRWIIDIRQPAQPRLLGELLHGSGAVVEHDHHLYVADGRDGVWVYAPDLPWWDDPSVPSPTPIPTETPGASPTPSPTPDCAPTPSVTISPTSTSIVTPTATGGTPDPSPEGVIYLPWVEVDRE